MKRLLYFISALSILSLGLQSCVDEDEFKIVGDPYFSLSVAGNAVMSIDNPTQYTLKLESNAYTNKASGSGTSAVMAASVFTVSSNLQWKIVPAGDETYDWVYLFPGEGEKDGEFIFVNKRNISLTDARSAYFDVMVDKGSGFESLAMIVVEQNSSAELFEYSAGYFNAEATSSKLTLTITANVDWTYTLTPMEDYATPDVSWITDTNYHVASKQVDTLVFRLAANESTIRGANVNLSYTLGGEEKSLSIPITQYSANEVAIEGFPVKWVVGTDGYNYASTWPSSGTISATEGVGEIKYVSIDKTGIDVNGKYALDVSAKCPRVFGVWPGDYLQFKVDKAVSAGTLIKISFETRVSATGHKYWRLEYKDGDEYKIAGKSYTVDIPASSNYEAQNGVVYTHAMESDGSTNIQVSNVVKYENTTDAVVFRFVCAANYQASGNGPLAAPNGGTWRLAVSDLTSDTWQPTIACVQAGTETISEATISVSGLTNDVLTFEGTDNNPKSFTVTSSDDFTVSADCDWLTFDVTSGEAETATKVTVTCADNESTSSRRAVIDIKAGITHYYVTAVQSAAGADFDPLLSVVGGNSKSFGYDPNEFTVQVLANVPVSYEIVDGGDWLTSADGMSTTAMVEKTEYKFAVTSNKESYVERSAKIRFYNEQYGLESVLAVTQSGVTPLYTEWLFTADTYNGGVHSAFSSAAGTDAAKAAGDGGAYASSNVSGTGKIYWFNGVDKTSIDTNGKASRSIGATGHPLITGAWPGDYWLFTATDDSEYAAGTKVHISFITRISAGGQKYWMLEYWDGQAWQPVYDKKTDTVGDETVTYNFLPTTASSNTKVDFTWTLAASCKVMQFRYSCVANYTAKSKVLTAPDGGTCRIAGAAGTSPVFEVVAE